MKRLFIAVALVLCGLFGAISVAQPAMAVTCPNGSKNQGIQGSLKSIAQCNMEETDGSKLMSTANTIINVVLGVVGLVAVAMIIVGGISYTTSQGDSAKATKAKNTILYSVVGLIIALLAFAVVNFVLGGIFG